MDWNERDLFMRLSKNVDKWTPEHQEHIKSLYGMDTWNPENQKYFKDLYEDDRCYNCESYGWMQADTSVIQQCQRCKGVTYCSKVCQMEHWNKVHRKHCKYFLGSKVKESSLHNPKTCTKCIHMQKLKGKQIMNMGSMTLEMYQNQKN